MGNRKQVVIIGAGATGLLAAKLLQPHFDVVILEKDSPGGLCKTRVYDGVPVDTCGGHIMYTQFKEVWDLIFDIMPKEQWHQSARNAKIWMENEVVKYPFEKSKHYEKVLMSQNVKVANNLKDYCLNRFGSSNCEKYFFPYNEKIWEYTLNDIGINWICPTKIPTGSGPMMKLDFLYPKKGGIQTFINKICPDAKIICNSTIKKIWNKKNKIHLLYHAPGHGGQLTCDILINTAPLNKLLHLLGGDIGFPGWDQPSKNTLDLPFHGTDLLVCKSDFFKRNPDISWIYFPEKEIPFHRIANLSYLQHADHDTVLMEYPYKMRRDKVELQDYSFEIIDSLRHKMTYPIEPVGDYERKNAVIQNLEKNRNIFSLGRWGKHEYWNIDFCFKDVVDACLKIGLKNV